MLQTANNLSTSLPSLQSSQAWGPNRYRFFTHNTGWMLANQQADISLFLPTLVAMLLVTTSCLFKWWAQTRLTSVILWCIHQWVGVQSSFLWKLGETPALMVMEEERRWILYSWVQAKHNICWQIEKCSCGMADGRQL